VSQHDLVAPEIICTLFRRPSPRSDAILSRRPDVKILYMSGYADDDGLRRGLLGRGASCLHKPFTSDALLGAVQALLASTDRTD